MVYELCRFDELRDLIRSQKNSMKIKDITKVQTGVIDCGVCEPKNDVNCGTLYVSACN